MSPWALREIPSGSASKKATPLCKITPISFLFRVFSEVM